MQVEYTGFAPSPDAGWTPKRVSANIDPKNFFTQFVATRTPCIINGYIKDPEFKGQLWDLDYLKKRAGNSIVDVEVKDAAGTFGKGNKKQMKFSKFVNSLKKGDQGMYITTQKLKEDEDGAFLELYGAPLKDLKDDFPISPQLLGNLLPNSVNLWMGNSKDGTSSGLHHDFHDNLYVLLKGQKKFTIVAPNEAPKLYTYGKIKKIHKNGLVNYPLTNPDGSLLQGVTEDPSGSESSEDDNNQGIDEALYAKLLNLDGEEDDDEEGEDQPPPDWGTLLGGEEAEDEEEYDLNDMWAKMEALQKKYTSKLASEKKVAQAKKPNEKPEKGAKGGKQQPDHFSRINLDAIRKQIPDRKLIPKNLKQNAEKRFPEATSVNFTTFTIKEGEMLYLPASWFHEVVSLGSEGTKNHVHMALNFWVHPPDTANFESPYSSPFWREFLSKTFPELKEKFIAEDKLSQERKEQEQEKKQKKQKKKEHSKEMKAKAKPADPEKGKKPESEKKQKEVGKKKGQRQQKTEKKRARQQAQASPIQRHKENFDMSEQKTQAKQKQDSEKLKQQPHASPKQLKPKPDSEKPKQTQGSPKQQSPPEPTQASPKQKSKQEKQKPQHKPAPKQNQQQPQKQQQGGKGQKRKAQDIAHGNRSAKKAKK